MRTRAQIDEYVHKVTYGLLASKPRPVERIPQNVHDTFKASRLETYRSLAFVSRFNHIRENLVLAVDCHPVLLLRVAYIAVDVQLLENIRESVADLEIKCSGIPLASYIETPSEYKDYDFMISEATSMVIWRHDKPCFTLKLYRPGDEPSVSFMESGETYLNVSGRWEELHDYIIGHRIYA